MCWRGRSPKPHQKLIWSILPKKRVITIQKLFGNRVLASRSDFGVAPKFSENSDFSIFLKILMISLLFSIVFIKGLAILAADVDLTKCVSAVGAQNLHQKWIWIILPKKRVITIQKLFGNRVLASRSDFGVVPIFLKIQIFQYFWFFWWFPYYFPLYL